MEATGAVQGGGAMEKFPGEKSGRTWKKIPGRTSGEPGGKSQGEPRDFRLRPMPFHCRLLPLLPWQKSFGNKSFRRSDVVLLPFVAVLPYF